MNDSVFQVMAMNHQYHNSIRTAIAEFHGIPSIGVSEYTCQQEKYFNIDGRRILSLKYEFVREGDRYFIKHKMLCSKELGNFLKEKGLINED